MSDKQCLVIITTLGVVGFVTGLLLFAPPQWFNPFVGVMICTVLPFAGAMTAQARKEPKT